MIVTGWRGGTYGVRIGKRNVRTYFDRSWNEIEVEIDGKAYKLPLRNTFWTTCPEFRGSVIGVWFKQNKLIPWKPGKPPKLNLTKTEGNRFILSL